MAAYCEVADLLVDINDINLPDGILPEKYIQDAADEIDSNIGFLYSTPIVIPEAQREQYRPTLLALKRINAHLATGRLVMAAFTAGEDDQIHAYGEFLVKQALEAIRSIATRSVILEGADPNTNDPSRATSRGYVFQLDKTSAVESFYDIVTSNSLGVLDSSYGSFQRRDV